MSFPAKVVLAAAVLLLLAAAALLLLGGGEAGIRTTVEEGVAAALRGDAEACVSNLAPGYSHGGLTRDQVADQIRTYVKPLRWSSIEILSLDPSADGDTGRAEVRLMLSDAGGFRMPLALMLHFRKDGGRWRVSGYDVLSR